MDIPIWKDRVWLTLAFGPFLLMAAFAYKAAQWGWQLGIYWVLGLILTMAVVSIFFDTVRGRRLVQVST